MEKLASFLSMETLILFDFVILSSGMTVRHTYLSHGLDFGVSIPQKFFLVIETRLMASTRLDTLQVESLTFPDHVYLSPYH
ncbi:hypothetical protein T03_14082 [Trichinella britovi]|uniref:Uncharacterized protein n=1 Tax=Trichinella britovi TaxID=45882 RepID=A0A0V1CRR9_TRIBR|nr:hypothetical protein T03_14082 [Trichinella britovi]